MLLSAVLSVAVSAAPAAAHDGLVSSSPADGATVARTPTEVVLTLSEPAVAMGTTVVVNGPAGPVASGGARLVDRTVSQSLAAGAPAGRYLVSWRVTSTDGHPVNGQLRFTSQAPSAARSGAGGGPTSTPAPIRSQQGRKLLLGGGAVVAVALVLSLVSRSRVTNRPSTKP